MELCTTQLQYLRPPLQKIITENPWTKGNETNVWRLKINHPHLKKLSNTHIPMAAFTQN
jgi:hypothetical protein